MFSDSDSFHVLETMEGITIFLVMVLYRSGVQQRFGFVRSSCSHDIDNVSPHQNCNCTDIYRFTYERV